jgi:phytol kinase
VAFISSILEFFFGQNFPDVQLIIWLFPLCFLYVIGVLLLDERMRSLCSWKVGYTRKFFHFMIFAMAGGLQYWKGIGGVFVLGWAVSLIILYLIWKGKSSKYYLLLARPKDEPHPTRYIIYPYLATFLGGVVSNFYFLPIAAVAGYLAAGLGDAIGEPVGTKWGKHQYPVYSWGSAVKSPRSLEGSLAVFLVSMIAFMISMHLYNFPIEWYKIAIAALIAAIVEGLSPHGWDNFTSQVAGAILMSYFLM